MHWEKSLKEIEKMPPKERWRLAREKLSNSDGSGTVSALLEHMRAHENTRWLVYDSRISKQIPRSFAANAFIELQRSVLHYEIVRLCTFWDQVDLDGRSIPTVMALADCSGVARCVYDDHYLQYEQMDLGRAKAWGQKARRRLRTAVLHANQIAGSDALKNVKNYRDKLAHQLEKTNEEKKAPVPMPRYGDERKLLGRTITVVNGLYLSLNGTSFGWDSAKAMHKRNAEAFWSGVRIEVLR